MIKKVKNLNIIKSKMKLKIDLIFMESIRFIMITVILFVLSQYF